MAKPGDIPVTFGGGKQEFRTALDAARGGLPDTFNARSNFFLTNIRDLFEFLGITDAAKGAGVGRAPDAAALLADGALDASGIDAGAANRTDAPATEPNRPAPTRARTPAATQQETRFDRNPEAEPLRPNAAEAHATRPATPDSRNSASAPGPIAAAAEPLVAGQLRREGEAGEERATVRRAEQQGVSSEDRGLFQTNGVLSQAQLLALNSSSRGGIDGYAPTEFDYLLRKKEEDEESAEATHATLSNVALIARIDEMIEFEENKLADLQSDLERFLQERAEVEGQIATQEQVVAQAEAEVAEQQSYISRYDRLMSDAQGMNETIQLMDAELRKKVALLALGTNEINQQTIGEAFNNAYDAQTELLAMEENALRDQFGSFVAKDENGYYRVDDNSNERIYFGEEQSAALAAQEAEGRVPINDPAIEAQRQRVDELFGLAQEQREIAGQQQSALVDQSLIREHITILRDGIQMAGEQVAEIRTEMSEVEQEVFDRYGLTIDELREDTLAKMDLAATERAELLALRERHQTLNQQITQTEASIAETQQRISDLQQLRERAQSPENQELMQRYYGGDDVSQQQLAESLQIPEWLAADMSQYQLSFGEDAGFGTGLSSQSDLSTNWFALDTTDLGRVGTSATDSGITADANPTLSFNLAASGVTGAPTATPTQPAPEMDPSRTQQPALQTGFAGGP